MDDPVIDAVEITLGSEKGVWRPIASFVIGPHGEKAYIPFASYPTREAALMAAREWVLRTQPGR